MALAVGDGDKQQVLLIPTDDDLQTAVVVAVGPGMSCDSAASVGVLLAGCGCWMSFSADAEQEPVS
jgi:hypothetical protein